MERHRAAHHSGERADVGPATGAGAETQRAVEDLGDIGGGCSVTPVNQKCSIVG
jgi:hypothetical protein